MAGAILAWGGCGQESWGMSPRGEPDPPKGRPTQPGGRHCARMGPSHLPGPQAGPQRDPSETPARPQRGIFTTAVCANHGGHHAPPSLTRARRAPAQAAQGTRV